MKLLRCLFSPIVLVFLLTLAACGSTSTASSGYNSTPASNSGTPPSAASTTGTTLRTASAVVNGKNVTLLTNAKGMTLYRFTPDTATSTACTGGCASTWPPLLSGNASVPTSVASLPGKLTVQTNANGQQIEYNGHPLYTYSGDTSPGQTNGEGVGNQWFVATTNLATNAGNGSATPSSKPYHNSGY